MPVSSRMTESLRKRLVPIKAALFDVDGVLVDCNTVKPTSGMNSKEVAQNDKEAIKAAIREGITVGIITSRASKSVEDLADTLGITDLYQGYLNKSSAYDEFKHTYNLEDEEIAYMGDDILDLAVMKMVGFSAAPFNAVSSIRIAANFVCRSKGGHGAAAEMLSLLFDVRPSAREH
jgi:3-deoxy-D-manno-octulosonate 8-phosphate phosphatase (KDO 8-P phosphatase)